MPAAVVRGAGSVESTACRTSSTRPTHSKTWSAPVGSTSRTPSVVVFMVGRTSRTWPLIAHAGVFCVNVLGAGQGELCRGFAKSGADKFAGFGYDAAPVSGSPRLAGASAWIDRTIQVVHTGGDHLLVVGRVDALGAGEDEGTPLLFHRGQFL
ncbi:flavin reductase family protein [Streptomyces turgidiscabies]|uniref:Flavin reductase (DIM6/NTAB) family NADH-FMN oxidoreductase RutF n=1 Tax=Streptomyces turgidiscabies TaxID=85558 RepID=A0ABU0RRL4_9ACTN|nr:flavin reductase (DIM6/NTAB) family NADH-FMN oxidoreductase RutF [Streptomyces turgidiscabies]